MHFHGGLRKQMAKRSVSFGNVEGMDAKGIPKLGRFRFNGGA